MSGKQKLAFNLRKVTKNVVKLPKPAKIKGKISTQRHDIHVYVYTMKKEISSLYRVVAKLGFSPQSAS